MFFFLAFPVDEEPPWLRGPLIVLYNATVVPGAGKVLRFLNETLRPGHYERAVWIVDAGMMGCVCCLKQQGALSFPRLVGSTFDRFAVAVT